VASSRLCSAWLAALALMLPRLLAAGVPVSQPPRRRKAMVPVVIGACFALFVLVPERCCCSRRPEGQGDLRGARSQAVWTTPARPDPDASLMYAMGQVCLPLLFSNIYAQFRVGVKLRGGGGDWPTSS